MKKTMREELILKCQDNCSCFSIDVDEHDGDYIITTYKSYHKSGFINKIKDIYRIICGKKVVDTEIILTKIDFNKIRLFNLK